jgi:hypothetical protein
MGTTRFRETIRGASREKAAKPAISETANPAVNHGGHKAVFQYEGPKKRLSTEALFYFEVNSVISNSESVRYQACKCKKCDKLLHYGLFHSYNMGYFTYLHVCAFSIY